MDDNTGRTPHSEDPAEGTPDADTLNGRRADTPEHNTAPDGYSTADDPDGYAMPGEPERHSTADERDSLGGATGGAIQGDSARGESTGGAIQGDSGPRHDDSPGGAIQGDSAHDESTGGAIQGDANPDHAGGTWLGGHETTDERLDADNAVEADSLKTLDPDNPPA